MYVVRSSAGLCRENHLLADRQNLCTSRIECSDEVKLGGCIFDGHRKIAIDLKNRVVRNIYHDADRLLDKKPLQM